MSTPYMDELVRDHTLTHVHMMENITDRRSLVRGACAHTGGGTKMRILVSHMALKRAASGNVPISMHLMAAAEGFLQQRHMLDHRYPRLTQLLGILNGFQRQQLIRMTKAGWTGPGLVNSKNEMMTMPRDVLRDWKAKARRLGRFRKQFEYMEKLQDSRINGGSLPPRPQDTVEMGTGIRWLNPDFDILVLMLVDERLRAKQSANRVIKIYGGGKYMNITVPTYIKRHIDAIGLEPALFFHMAEHDYTKMSDNKSVWDNAILYESLLLKSAAERGTKEHRTRAVLFTDMFRTLRFVATPDNNRWRRNPSRAAVVVVEVPEQTRNDQIPTSNEGLSLWEIKENDPDRFTDLINDNWNEYTPDEKKSYDPERYRRELKELGNEAKEETMEEDEGLTPGDRGED